MKKEYYWRLVVVFLIESGYFFASRHISVTLGWDSSSGEVFRTFLRIVTALIDYELLRGLVVSRSLNRGSFKSPGMLIAGAAMFFLTPVLMGSYGLPLGKGCLFAITSVFVAVKEEVLFRGILLNCLDSFLGIKAAVLLSGLAFMIWHVGMINPSLWSFLQVLMAGLFLGVMYIRSGSLLLVIALHAVYDALFSLSPFLASPLSTAWGGLMLGSALILALMWGNKSKRLVAT